MSRKKLKLLAKSQIKRNVAILFVFYLVSAAIMGAFIGFRINFFNFWAWKQNLNYNYLPATNFTFSLGVPSISSILILIFH